MKKKKGFIDVILKMVLIPVLLFSAVSIVFFLSTIALRIRITTTIEENFEHNAAQDSLLALLYSTYSTSDGEVSIYRSVEEYISESEDLTFEELGNRMESKLDLLKSKCYEITYDGNTLAEGGELFGLGCEPTSTATAKIALPFSDKPFGNLVLKIDYREEVG